MRLSSLLDPLRGRHAGTAFDVREDLVPAAVWLVLPLALLAATVVLLLTNHELFIWWVRQETGAGENITAVLFVLSGVLALVVARQREALPLRWLRAAFYAIGILALLIAGEEWSWGQHFFGWQSPEWLGAINSQQETNLHNVAPRALDQKPRALASIIILIFGFLVPVFRRRMAWLDQFPVFDWLLPGRLLIPTSLIVVLPRVIDRIQVWFDVGMPGPFFVSTRGFQELQELFIGIFVFIYLLNVFLRIKRFQRSRPGRRGAIARRL